LSEHYNFKYILDIKSVVGFFIEISIVVYTIPMYSLNAILSAKTSLVRCPFNLSKPTKIMPSSVIENMIKEISTLMEYW